jgi:multiple sugar transport system permease protein
MSAVGERAATGGAPASRPPRAPLMSDAERARMRRRRTAGRRLRRVLRWFAVTAMCVWVFAPFYFLLLVAFQTKADSLRTPPVWFPKPDFSNFTKILDHAFSSAPAANPSDLIVPGIRNSAIVAISVALLNVVLGASAGYAFARVRFRGNRAIPLALLGSQMVPAFALLVPYYIVLRNLGLTNTRLGVVIAELSITLPFTVWLLRSYFSNVPVELERAARIDGCGRLQTFLRVALPLARPGLIAVGLFAFMVSWNDFLFQVILNSNVDAIMIQPAIAGLYNVREQSFGIMAAGSLLAALPTMVFALVTQRYLVRGLMSGAGKV